MSPRILLVDDDPDIVFMSSIALQHAGFEVVEAPTGEAALEAIAREVLDAVVLDLRLPGIDGFAVLEAIKKDPALSALPVIIISAHASGRAAAEADRMGATAYITKPFLPDHLVETLRLAVAPED